MIHVLIVEDEKAISNLIRLSLTKEGFFCTCAGDGAEAADLLEKNTYDLVLLEVMLLRPGEGPAPGGGGLYHQAL